MRQAAPSPEDFRLNDDFLRLGPLELKFRGLDVYSCEVNGSMGFLCPVTFLFYLHLFQHKH